MGSEVLEVRVSSEAELSPCVTPRNSVMGNSQTHFSLRDSDLRLCKSAVLLTSLRGQILSLWQERRGLLLSPWCVMTPSSGASEVLCIFRGQIQTHQCLYPPCCGLGKYFPKAHTYIKGLVPRVRTCSEAGLSRRSLDGWWHPLRKDRGTPFSQCFLSNWL